MIHSQVDWTTFKIKNQIDILPGSVPGYVTLKNLPSPLDPNTNQSDEQGSSFLQH